MESESHGSNGVRKPVVIPTLFLGIDLTDMERQVIDMFKAVQSGSPPPDSSKFNRIGQESFRPRNRLRRIP